MSKKKCNNGPSAWAPHQLAVLSEPFPKNFCNNAVREKGHANCSSHSLKKNVRFSPLLSFPVALLLLLFFLVGMVGRGRTFQESLDVVMAVPQRYTTEVTEH